LHPSLASLVALQALDTAADLARKRLAELPAAEQSIATAIAAEAADVARLKAEIKANHDRRRDLEKEVAAVDTRLARFEDHKAAVKTNQEYTALLHEIATAKSEKDAVEEKILVLMESADTLASQVKAGEAALAAATREGDERRKALTAENATQLRELDRLTSERRGEVSGLPAPLVAKYDQLLKGRRGLAVAPMTGEICAACHVRQRPHVAQIIRRNEEIVQCESCQRILYFAGPPA
jgi:predicted  nucleic acid-binding Zn-ribbon protein